MHTPTRAATHVGYRKKDQVGEGVICPERVASPKYANQAICTLTHMLTKAKEWHLIAEVPTLHKREAFARDRYITPEDEVALLKVASQPLRDVLIIAMDTGMRPFEIFRMRWEDVIWGNGVLRRQVQDEGRTPQRSYLRKDERDAIARSTESREGWVFPSKTGRGHLKSVAVAFRNARRRAGLDPRLVLYSARHAYGTYLMRETGNLPLVMQDGTCQCAVHASLPASRKRAASLRDRGQKFTS